MAFENLNVDLLKVPITPKNVFPLKKIFVFLWVKWWENDCFCLKTWYYFMRRQSHRKSLKKFAQKKYLFLWVKWWENDCFCLKTWYYFMRRQSHRKSLKKFAQILSFQAKTIILSPFYSQKHRFFFSRKQFLGYRHFNLRLSFHPFWLPAHFWSEVILLGEIRCWSLFKQ